MSTLSTQIQIRWGEVFVDELQGIGVAKLLKSLKGSTDDKSLSVPRAVAIKEMFLIKLNFNQL